MLGTEEFEQPVECKPFPAITLDMAKDRWQPRVSELLLGLLTPRMNTLQPIDSEEVYTGDCGMHFFDGVSEA